jgi:hypothetical protein
MLSSNRTVRFKATQWQRQAFPGYPTYFVAQSTDRVRGDTSSCSRQTESAGMKPSNEWSARETLCDTFWHPRPTDHPLRSCDTVSACSRNYPGRRNHVMSTWHLGETVVDRARSIRSYSERQLKNSANLQTLGYRRVYAQRTC